MLFVVTRTSGSTPPCVDAKLEHGWQTYTISSAYLDEDTTQAVNVRETPEKDCNGNSIMQYESRADFWFVQFHSLDDLLAWVKQYNEVIIQASDGPVYPAVYWLQDLKSKVDGYLEIYDSWRE